MILSFKKRVYPSNKIMMFIIVKILLKKLDLEKLFQKHLMSQFNPCTIRYLDHNITIILCILFIIELEMTFELLVQSLVYVVLILHLFEQCELVIKHLLLVVLALCDRREQTR